MSVLSWVRKLFVRRPTVSPARRGRCRLETLEDRITPAPLAFRFTFDDPNNQLAPFPLLRSNLEAAGRIISQQFAGQGTIDVVVRVDNSRPRLGGAEGSLTDAGTSGGLMIRRPGTISEARTGVDPNGTDPDLILLIQTETYLPNLVFLDPDPMTRTTPIPPGRADMVSLAMHEMLHGLGFNGFRITFGAQYGTFADNFRTSYDALTSFGAGVNANTLFFNGPLATAAYGGPVPLTSVGPNDFLTSQNFFHVGNPMGRPGADLQNDLMNGVAFGSQRYPLGALDVAMLSDLGLPRLVRVSVSNPTPQTSAAGERQLAFRVNLSAAANLPVTVDFATADGSGIAGTDYVPASGTLTFAPGETSKIVVVTVRSDKAPVLRLSNPSFNAMLGAAGQAKQIFAVGAGTGNDAAVKVYNNDGSERSSFIAYDATRIGVRTAVGDLNADGFADVVVATLAGPGIREGHLRAFDGRTGTLLASFLALPGYVGGAYVAVGDVNGDGFGDVIVSVDQADPSGPSMAYAGGRVRIFDGRSLIAGQQVVLSDFQAYPGFLGGVRVAAGDVDGDGLADVVTGSGPGVNQAPHVKVFSAGDAARLIRSYFAYSEGFFGGVFVAVANLDNDGFADIVTGADNFGHVKGFRGRDNSELFSFIGLNGGTGGQAGVADLNGDGIAEVLLSVRQPGTSVLRALDVVTTQARLVISPFPGFAGDVSVSG